MRTVRHRWRCRRADCSSARRGTFGAFARCQSDAPWGMTNAPPMTNDEGMTNAEIRMTKQSALLRHWSFVIRHSFVIGHWWGIGGAFKLVGHSSFVKSEGPR